MAHVRASFSHSWIDWCEFVLTMFPFQNSKKISYTLLEMIAILIYVWYIKFKNVCILRDCV